MWQDNLDFPVSHTFFRSLCLQHGESDPGPCYKPVVELPDIWEVDVSERAFKKPVKQASKLRGPDPQPKSVTRQPLKPQVYLPPVKDVQDISI